MPSIAELNERDPAHLGGYSLRGRLGEGGQGVVYLGVDDGGAPAAIKWLRPHLATDAKAAERFAREAAAAQRVAPFCTAKVLGTGVHDGRPYIVSEYVEGMSLHRAVTQEGPRTESALHRLAIGTATALAAIHQAGIVHRDFSPNNVLLGAEGPRVIDFGIAKALDATSTLSSMPVGTPAFMAPEQILAQHVGPAADMFAWASTIVFAASGIGPFSAESVPAVIHRVLYTEPDLRSVTGPLRELVAACLSKDPARRPSAEQVILRLLEQPSSNPVELQQAAAVVSGHLPPPHQRQPQQQQWAAPSFQPPPPHYGAPTQPPMPVRRSRRGLMVAGIAATVAILATITVVVVAVRNLPKTTPVAGRTSAPASQQPSASQSPSPSVTAVPTANLASAKLPGTDATIYESPTDPIRLTTYSVRDTKTKNWTDYPRDSLTGAFKKSGKLQGLLSPDGRYLAERPTNWTDGYDAVIITDKVSGESFTVKTSKKPLASYIEAWSRDSRRLLLDMGDTDKDKVWQSTGFLIVDVTTRNAKLTSLREGSLKSGNYGFDDQSTGVVIADGSAKQQALRFFNDKGERVRTIPNIGGAMASGMFSPTGKQFATVCPGLDTGSNCVYDSQSGSERARVETDCVSNPWWYDEAHLACWVKPDSKAGRQQIQVMDFEGKMVRLLADIPTNGDNITVTYTYTRAG